MKRLTSPLTLTLLRLTVVLVLLCFPSHQTFDSACRSIDSLASQAASPIDGVPATSSNIIITTSSVPIATSTPVSPPLLQSKRGEPTTKTATSTTTTTTMTKASKDNRQYPAVLKGNNRMTTGGASPPNPNLVPSKKVPPPVPPRGSISGKGKLDSSSSQRGDNPQRFLHESSPHVMTAVIHRPTPAQRLPLPPPHVLPNNNIRDYIISEETTSKTHRRNTEYVHYGMLQPQRDSNSSIPNDDEFVSVEVVDNSYVIKTSPYPFRPERGLRRRGKDTVASSSPIIPPRFCPELHPRTNDGYTPSINMPKFTYFINPAGNEELMNWKMSRKDKKHSETYSERMRRIQEEERNKPLAKPDVTLTIGSTVRNDGLLTKIRKGYAERKNRAANHLAERFSKLRFNRGSDDDIESTSDAEPTKLKKSHKFLGHAYPELTRSRDFFKNLSGSNPNIRRSSKDENPETRSRYSFTDEQYKDYLDEQSDNTSRKFRAIQRNPSFLHGYASDH